MNIIYIQGKFTLQWTYNIRSNKSTKKNKEYYFYSTVFPAELTEYYKTDKLYAYIEEHHIYLTPTQPDVPEYKEIRLFNKGTPQRAKDLTLSKKFFKQLQGNIHGKVIYTLHLDEEDHEHHRGKLEIQLIIE